MARRNARSDLIYVLFLVFLLKLARVALAMQAEAIPLNRDTNPIHKQGNNTSKEIRLHKLARVVQAMPAEHWAANI